MKHIIIYLAIALVMFGLLGWYFAQQEDLQPKALQAELSVSNVAKLPQQKVEMLFSDMSNEEKNSFRIAIQNELGAAVDVAAHDCMGSAEVQMTYAKKVLEQGCTVLMLEPVNDTVTDELLALAQEYDVPVGVIVQIFRYNILSQLGCATAFLQQALQFGPFTAFFIAILRHRRDG